MPAELITETNYTIGTPLEASIGDDMLVMSQIAKSSTAFKMAQAMSVGAIDEDAQFIATLTYTGKSDSKISLVYREYAGTTERTVARAAFSLELEYDLDESEVISFRSLRIEILEATNNLIRYTVVEDGGLPWLSAG